MIENLISWILLTLGVVAISAIFAEIYGVEIAIGVFAALTVIANVLAFKIVNFAIFSVPSAVIIYASTFLMTDIVGERFGKKYARNAVWSGFIANLIYVLAATIAVKWEPAPFMSADSVLAFDKVLGFAPRVVFASMVAYLISQHHDVFAFHWWKEKTKGKHLWLRNNASTMVSQAIDTTIFITLAFYGSMPLLPMIIGQYTVKVLIAMIDTPFIYAVNFLADYAVRSAKV
ncbi:MAG: queuosine precursor transporter [Candidatus Hydrothermarchaeota archaeon]